MAYLHHHYESDSTTELTRMHQREKAYQIIREELYKTSVTRPLLRCLSTDGGKELLTQIHAGVRRSHWSKGPHCKGVQARFPLAIYNRRCCEACQNLPSMSKVLAKYSSSVTTHSAHHTLVAIAKVGHRHSGTANNSTRELQIYSGSSRVLHKVEAKPVVNIAVATLKRFFWQNKMWQLGVPREITIDNVKQFECHLFKDFCYQMGVEAAFASVYHPQSNGAVEKANKLIFTAIKKILENQTKGKWAEELPRVLWSHNTSVCMAKKFSPFKLLYGEEPVTPEEIKLHSARTNMEAIHSPSEAESKNLLEPKYMKAVKNLQSYQNETKAWRDKKVKLKHIEVGDLVLLWSPRTEASGKLEPKWTGPFVVVEKTRP
jgi:hypothetical protein